MRFYDRETELKVLRDTAAASLENSQFTVVLGRRRVGKTTLMLRGAEGTKTSARGSRPPPQPPASTSPGGSRGSATCSRHS